MAKKSRFVGIIFLILVCAGCGRINNLFLPVDPREALFVNESPRYTVYVFVNKPYNENPEPGQESFVLPPFGRKEKIFENFGKYEYWYWFDYKTRIGTYQIVVPPRSFTVDFQTITHYGPQDEEWGEVIQFFPEQYVPDGYWY